MRAIILTAAITVVLVVGGMQWFTNREQPELGFCRAQVGSTTVEIDLEQATWASLMAAIAHRRDLPPRATTIAIATAYQESKIHNIDYGDRDSVGLFQQRPSQGWGAVDQILDPHYSIRAFYDGLVRVNGYQNMAITDAAQAVQRSAFPTAYAQHEANARALASALRGHSPAAFACAVESREPDPSALVELLNKAWGTVTVVEDGDDYVIRLNGPAEDTIVRGWALAQFIVANAALHGVSEIRFDDMQWQAHDQRPEWTPTEGESRTEVRYRLG